MHAFNKVLSTQIICITLFLLYLNAVIPVAALGQATRISETVRPIKTYPFGDPSPVPILNNKPEIYPYFRFDGFATTSEYQDWKVVELENDYIRLAVLPQVGGKIFGAVEKSTGKEFIYQNDVLKFRDVALRGPWSSGGIEFNFGYYGHTASTATPVDYIMKENSDGSVSCFVGGLDLSSRTQWRVEIRLPRDASSFQTQSFWYNPTAFHQLYYHWMNAAIAAGEDLEFYFPGTHYIGHSGTAYSWPVTKEGKEISKYKNNNFGNNKSYHVLGQYSQYSGGYWRDSNFGYGHWSRHDEMPGQKVWIWSHARSGAIWEDLLTDTSGQYVEVQSGRQLSQAALPSGLESPFTQALFQPQATDSWQEYWFPIKNTGGISDASPHGVMYVEQKDQVLKIALNALKNLSDSLIVEVDGEKQDVRLVELQPMETYKIDVEIPVNTKSFSVSLGNKLSYKQPDTSSLQRPVRAKSKNLAKASSAEGLFRRAEEYFAFRQFKKALDIYKEVIQQEPNHLQTLTRIAEIYTRRGEYDKASSFVKSALEQDTYDAAANFIYGIISQKKGHFNQAKDAFGWAARSMKYRSAGYTQMAKVYLLNDLPEEAVYYTQKALAFNSYNMQAKEIKAVSHRLIGDTNRANTEVADILEVDPLSHFARFEKTLLNPSEENRKSFTSLIRNELPHESYLELAIKYSNLGRTQDASEVLNHAPNQPIVKYWQAYLVRANSEKSAKYLQQALSLSPRLVFPFRLETIPVLRWALQQREHWKTQYYLGLILWGKGREKEAAGLLQKCGTKPDFAPFYLSRSELLEKHNPHQVLKDLKHAFELDPSEWRTYRALNEWYSSHNDLENALQISREAHHKFPANYYVGMQYVAMLNQQEQYETAISVLEDLKILPYEGATEGHRLYESAHLMLAGKLVQKNNYDKALRHVEKSRLWPEHLGVGRPFNPDERYQDYVEGLINQKKGDSEKAKELFHKVISYSIENWDNIKREGFTAANFVSYLVLKKEGAKQKISDLRHVFEQDLGKRRFQLYRVDQRLDTTSDSEELKVPKWLSSLREINLHFGK